MRRLLFFAAERADGVVTAAGAAPVARGQLNAWNEAMALEDTFAFYAEQAWRASGRGRLTSSA